MAATQHPVAYIANICGGSSSIKRMIDTGLQKFGASLLGGLGADAILYIIHSGRIAPGKQMSPTYTS